MENALKYSKSNTRTLIKISSAKVQDTDYPNLNLEAHKIYYAISVSDNGIGFESEYIDKVFELFYRLPKTEENYKGTGVGLSICKKIAENHHGFIFAQTQLHIGSEFTFILPENS